MSFFVLHLFINKALLQQSKVKSRSGQVIKPELIPVSMA